MIYAIWNGNEHPINTEQIAQDYAKLNPNQNVLMITLGGGNALNGYFNERLVSPQRPINSHTHYATKLTDNLYSVSGDNLPLDKISEMSEVYWRNVRLWLRELVYDIQGALGGQCVAFIECTNVNLYTEMVLASSDRIILATDELFLLYNFRYRSQQESLATALIYSCANDELLDELHHIWLGCPNYFYTHSGILTTNSKFKQAYRFSIDEIKPD